MANFLEEKSSSAPLEYNSMLDKIISLAAKSLPHTVGECLKRKGFADSYELEEGGIALTKKVSYPRAGSEPVSIRYLLFLNEDTRRIHVQVNPIKVKVSGKGGKQKTVYLGYTEGKAAEITEEVKKCLRDVPRTQARNVAALNEVSRGIKTINSAASRALSIQNVQRRMTGYLAPTRNRRNNARNVRRNLMEKHYNVNPNLKAIRMGWTKGKSANQTMKNKKGDKGNKGPKGAGADE
jgi:hypothetical protein